MYPKYFFERFWEGEQKNQLFVGTAFDDSIDERFSLIDSVAKELGFEKAFRVGLDSEANSINDKIFEAIANSKMLLFDLSDDSRKKHINHNVIYELGIAQAIREPSDIIIIRKKTEEHVKLPFDIQGININFFENQITKEFLKSKLNDAIKNQEWHKSKRVRVAAESLDENGLTLINSIGRRPKGYNHFNSSGFDYNTKMSVLRLVDLGILKFAWAIWPENKGYEYAYHWTSFGYEVMKHIGLNQMTLDEFKKTPEYPQVKAASDNFMERKKNALNEQK
ncbi:MAG: TIR domain-containing protein [Patescibacteria group bacterium]